MYQLRYLPTITDHNADYIRLAPAVAKRRWDHADLSQYYTNIGWLLQSLLLRLNDGEDNLSCLPDGTPVYVVQMYDSTVISFAIASSLSTSQYLQLLVGPGIK